MRLEPDPDAEFDPVVYVGYGYFEARAKPVVCELCARGQHRACVRPCTCRHTLAAT